MRSSGSIILWGDYGSASGAAKMLVPNMITEGYTAQQTKLQAFAAALTAAHLTDCGVGDITSSQKSESSGVKPDADVNVREKLVYAWRTNSNSSVRKGTVPGVSKTADIWIATAQGDRLNDVAKAALKGALEALYGITAPNEVIVLWGKNVEE